MQVCVDVVATPEDADDACCCTARASWGLYARLNSENDALWIHQEFRNFQDWDATWCIGLESSGARGSVSLAFYTFPTVPLF
jgi:hypothetical protein